VLSVAVSFVKISPRSKYPAHLLHPSQITRNMNNNDNDNNNNNNKPYAG
jgi:hypothetical protein